MDEMSDFVEGKGCGFLSKQGKKCMIRCFKCGRENYAMAVTSGTCAWCGYNANCEEEHKVEDDWVDVSEREAIEADTRGDQIADERKIEGEY